MLRRLVPLLEPTRNDKILPQFSNYADLWARQHPFPIQPAEIGGAALDAAHEKNSLQTLSLIRRVSRYYRCSQ